MIKFTRQSRHAFVSIIYILHNLRGLQSSKQISFTAEFLVHSTCLIVFRPFGISKSTIYRFLQNYIDKQSKNITYDHIFNKMFLVAASLSTHPYLMIQPRKNFSGYRIFRMDIFNKNLVLSEHGS